LTSPMQSSQATPPPVAAATPVPADVASMKASLEANSMRLHGIVSRTDSARIAAEVLRLNDAVRAVVARQGVGEDPPSSFTDALLALADSSNGEER
jgi:hypothetical protein